MVKTVFDKKTGELLGAHMIGAEVTELIQGYVIARQGELTDIDLAHTIFAQPYTAHGNCRVEGEEVIELAKRNVHRGFGTCGATALFGFSIHGDNIEGF